MFKNNLEQTLAISILRVIFIIFILKVQLTFEGVRGGGYRGDIAIDDFSLRPGSCSGTPAPPVGGLQDLFVHKLGRRNSHRNPKPLKDSGFLQII